MCVQEPCVYLLSAASVVIRNTKFCLFWLFRYRSETPKKPKIILFGFAKKTNRKTTETGWVLACFGSNRKKINCFEDTLIEICFLEIFSVCFSCFDTGLKHRNKLKQTDKICSVSRNKLKNNRNRLSFDSFWFQLKKNWIVSRTPYYPTMLAGFKKHVSLKGQSSEIFIPFFDIYG